MKKIVVFAMLLAFCLPLMLSVAVSADTLIPEIPESDKIDITVLSRHDFDDLASVNTSATPSNVAASAGFVALDGLDCKLQEGGLWINHDTKTSAFFDLQLWNVTDFPRITRDVIFSMKLKPLTDGFSAAHLLDYGLNGSGLEGERVTVSKRELKIGDQKVGELPLNQYSLIEWAFHYDADSGKFAEVDVLLNGVKVGSYTCGKTIKRIDHFRALRYSNGSCMVDEVTLAFGTTSILYAKNAEVTYTPEAPEIGESPIPTVPADQQVWMDLVNMIDFNDMETPNTDLSTDGLTKSHGFVALDGLDCSIVDGELVCRSTVSDAFFDLQFHETKGFPKLKEDVILSFKVKPLSTGFSIGHLLDYRFHTGDFDTGHSSISSCGLKIEKEEVGYLPYGVFSLVEFAFHYDTDNSEYDYVAVMLNGKTVASYEIDVTVARVNHFRMFRYISGDFAVDDIILAKGNTSLVYYSPNAEKPEAESKPADTGAVTQKPADTNAPNATDGATDTLTPAEPSATDTQNGEAPASGCAASVTVSALAGVLMLSMGAALLKRREDET